MRFRGFSVVLLAALLALVAGCAALDRGAVWLAPPGFYASPSAPTGTATPSSDGAAAIGALVNFFVPGAGTIVTAVGGVAAAVYLRARGVVHQAQERSRADVAEDRAEAAEDRLADQGDELERRAQELGDQHAALESVMIGLSSLGESGKPARRAARDQARARGVSHILEQEIHSCPPIVAAETAASSPKTGAPPS